MTRTHPPARAGLTVDCVVFGLGDAGLEVLLRQRARPPFRRAWALPGERVRLEETLDEAAGRVVREQAGIGGAYLEQLYTFGALDRDPRERVVTVAYYALVRLAEARRPTGLDEGSRAWFHVDRLPALAFDHGDIVRRAHARLRGKVRYAPIGFELLPPRFSLSQLQRLYELVLGAELDKRNFRKKLLAMDVLVETDEREQGVRHRAARLYEFDRRKYERLALRGVEFAV